MTLLDYILLGFVAVIIIPMGVIVAAVLFALFWPVLVAYICFAYLGAPMWFLTIGAALTVIYWILLT